MPYIPPKHRQELDGLLDELTARLAAEAKEYDDDGAFAGLLNYAVTRLALGVVRRQFGPLRYWHIAALTGMFKNVADEFYRRLAAPYEDRQRARNGDLDLFREYLEEMEQG
jgi:hypothetical protein